MKREILFHRPSLCLPGSKTCLLQETFRINSMKMYFSKHRGHSSCTSESIGTSVPRSQHTHDCSYPKPGHDRWTRDFLEGQLWLCSGFAQTFPNALHCSGKLPLPTITCLPHRVLSALPAPFFLAGVSQINSWYF